MALSDAENAAIASLLTGGVEAPLEEQPGTEEKPVELAMFSGAGGKMGNFVQRMLFGDGLFKSRQVLEDLKSGKRKKLDLRDMFADPNFKGLTEDELREVNETRKKVFNNNEVEVSIPENLAAGDKPEIKPTDKEFKTFQQERLSDAKPLKGLLTDFRVQGSRGDEKIPNEQSVLNTIEAISKSQAGKINEAKRGTIENAELEKLSDLVGLTPNALKKRILNKRKGETITVKGFGLAETMLASRTLLENEIRTLDELAELAANGNDQSLLAFRQQFELVSQLQAQIKGSQTEIARALAQFRIPTRNQQFNRLRNQDVSVLLDEFGGTDSLKIMAKRYLELDNDSAKAQLVRGNKSFVGKSMDAFYEMWINALLSSPVTHTKNVVGAFLTTFAHVPETYVAAGVGTLRRNLLGQTGGVQFGEANAQLFGAMMAFSEAWNIAKLAYKTGEKPILGSKIEMTSGQKFSSAFSAEAFGATGTMGNAVNVLGKFATLGGVPTSMLEFEDTYFKVIAQRMSLYQQAFREAKQRNLGVEDFAEYVANYVYDPPENAIMQADAHAQYVTLQQEVDEMGKKFKGLRNGPIARFFIPFFKTPYNAFKYAFTERTALGLASSNLRETMAAGMRPNATAQQKAASDMAIARQSMGAMTTALVIMYVSQGVITGGGPADRKHNASLRRQGWEPYSIRIGGKYYSYIGAEPFSSVISLVADAAETLMVYDTSNAQGMEIAGAVTLAVANQLTDKTFMQGFSNLVSVLQDPQRYTSVTIKNFARSLVPRVIAQGERMMDPTVRDARTIVESIQSQIPGLSKSLPPRRNIWGQAVIQDGAFGPDVMSPVYTNTVGPNTASIENGKVIIEGNAFSINSEENVKAAYIFDKEFALVGYGPSKLPQEIHSDVTLENDERNLMYQLMGHQTLEFFKEWAKDKSNIDRYLKRKKAYLEGGNDVAYDKIKKEFDMLVNRARDSVINLSGFRYSGLFFGTELGKQFKIRLDEHNKEFAEELQSIE